MIQRISRTIRYLPLSPTVRTLLSIVLVVHSGISLSRSADPQSAQIAALRERAQAYEHGEGVAKDSSKAADLYCQAARKGDSEAQFNLGWMYANGRGVERNDSHAAALFGMAARRGHEYAKKMLQYVEGATASAPSCLAPKAAIAAYSSSPALATRPEHKKLVELVNRIAPEFRIDPRLALAVISVESNFNPNARSPKNAQGLMQLIPETSERFNVKDPYDPVQNLRGGLRYLRWLLAYFRGDVTLAAAGYNAGEGAVDRYRGVPPFPETKAYVGRIVGAFKDTYHPYDPAVTAPSPELRRMKQTSGPLVPVRDTKNPAKPELVSDLGQPIRR